MNPAMKWRAVENAFKSLIKEAIGVPAVWTIADGPQPNLPYVSMTWIGFGNIGDSGHYDQVNSAGKIERNYYASRTAQVDVQVISDLMRAQDSALMLADALMTAMDTEQIVDRWLEPNGIAISDFTEVRDLSKIEDNVRVTSRVGFTLKLNIAVNAESAETFGPIEHVEISSDLPAGGDLTVSRS